MAIFKGAAVALVTPMNDKQEVNYEKLEELVNYHIDNGTDSIVICGTTGEASTLTHDEHLETIRACVEFTKKRVPVIAGTGSNCTRTAIYLSKEAQKHGADGLLVVTPYYNKATQKGLESHFGQIAKAVDVPILLYNVPSRTGCNILPKTAVSLAKEYDNIIGIKDATGNISQVARLMDLAEGCLDLYSGNDEQIVPILSLGGIGVISVLSNIAPKETHNMVEKYLAGDVKGSLEIQLKYIKVIDALFAEVSPIPVKKAMNLMGMDVGCLRSPLTEMEEKNVKVLQEEMKQVGLIK